MERILFLHIDHIKSANDFYTLDRLSNLLTIKQRLNCKIYITIKTKDDLNNSFKLFSNLSDVILLYQNKSSFEDLVIETLNEINYHIKVKDMDFLVLSKPEDVQNIVSLPCDTLDNKTTEEVFKHFLDK
jgi:hypothetical protein